MALEAPLCSSNDALPQHQTVVNVVIVVAIVLGGGGNAGGGGGGAQRNASPPTKPKLMCHAKAAPTMMSVAYD
jgi:hypothetical protein